VECSCVVISPKHLNTTTWALRLNPPVDDLRSNRQTVATFTMGFRYAACCRTVLLNAVSCHVQVLGAMTTQRLCLQRPASSPTRSCTGIRIKDMVQETHICVWKVLKANCSWWKRGLRDVGVANLGKFGDRVRVVRRTRVERTYQHARSE
jgi:hypothetical protein